MMSIGQYPDQSRRVTYKFFRVGTAVVVVYPYQPIVFSVVYKYETRSMHKHCFFHLNKKINNKLMQKQKKTTLAKTNDEKNKTDKLPANVIFWLVFFI